jgi:hypothetical protein
MAGVIGFGDHSLVQQQVQPIAEDVGRDTFLGKATCGHDSNRLSDVFSIPVELTIKRRSGGKRDGKPKHATRHVRL